MSGEGGKTFSCQYPPCIILNGIAIKWVVLVAICSAGDGVQYPTRVVPQEGNTYNSMEVHANNLTANNSNMAAAGTATDPNNPARYNTKHTPLSFNPS